MCAQFDLKVLACDLKSKYGITLPEDFIFNKRVTPHSQAPVITSSGLKMMKFSLLPSWSKESKVKFATHNARIETLDEKATWKIPFKKFHCLVPLTQFIEPIYVREHAGSMVSFSEKNQQLLTAAGLYDSWVNKITGEIIESFTIITTEPPPFVAEVGHDRCPVFLKNSAFQEWLQPTNTEAQYLKQFLLGNQEAVEFTVKKDRDMRPGWEKRK
ncbi:MAG: SOS response-associated peptidase [Bdellovibrionales bacterium]